MSDNLKEQKKRLLRELKAIEAAEADEEKQAIRDRFRTSWADIGTSIPKLQAAFKYLIENEAEYQFILDELLDPTANQDYHEGITKIKITFGVLEDYLTDLHQPQF